MRIFKNKSENFIIQEILKRPVNKTEKTEKIVKDIFTKIQKTGDKALIECTLKYDKVRLSDIRVSKQEIENSITKVSQDFKKAIKHAYKNIYKFHVAQKNKDTKIEIEPGIVCWRETKAIDKIGIYIPSGSAPLFSSVLMLSIPAIIAGCKQICLITPPNANGMVDDTILYVADFLGIKDIFKCGGIQAIGALTFGTKTIPQVHKIVGPGNNFVTTAKMEAIKYGIAIDIPAGPSELMIICDENVNPDWIAADVCAQLEHGTDSQVIIISDSDKIANNIILSIQAQINNLTRKEIIKNALLNSAIIIEEDMDTQINYINEYAPEHLIINTKKYKKYVARVHNAGSVFIGPYSAEAFGDYASGTNHTLPTNGNAKAYSGVSVDTFVKKITFQEITFQGAKKLAPTVNTMAINEKLDAHAHSVNIRIS